jgi:GH24 family phage-related lysozyme (muramidase)
MGKMNISQKGIDLIKSFEGLSLKAYKPVAGEKYWTIGYGHYGADVRQGQVITKEQAEALLKKDLQKYVDGVNSVLKVPINQNQFDALVSFAYNCGVGALQKSTLLKKLNAGDYVGASKEFGKWVHGAGGVVLKGLVTRRQKEAKLFNTPVVDNPTIATKPASSIPVKGYIQIVNVKHACYICDRPSSTNSKNLGTAKLGSKLPIAGSVKGWWEVIYNGKRAYVHEKYGRLVK